jgi:hypothetical protein
LIIVCFLAESFANASSFKNKYEYRSSEGSKLERKYKHSNKLAAENTSERERMVNSLKMKYRSQIKKLKTKIKKYEEKMGTMQEISCETDGVKEACNILNLAMTAGQVFQKKEVSKVHIITVSYKEFKLSELTNQIAKTGIQNIIKSIGLDTIVLKDSELSIAYGDRFAGKISTTIEYLGNDITVDVIGVKNTDTSKGLVLGIGSRFKLFVDIMKKFLGDGFAEDANHPLNLFEESDIFLMVSLGKVDFDKLSSLKPSYYDKVVDGISTDKTFVKIITNIRLKAPGDNKMLDFLKKYVMPGELTLSVKFSSEHIKGEIATGGILFDNGVELKKVSTYLEANLTKKPAQLTFGLKGVLSLPLKSTTLTLTGDIKIEPTQAGFEFKMDGVISHVLGLRRLHIGNLGLELKFLYTGGAPSMFRFNGELAVGLDCYEANIFIGDDYCIKAEGGFGLNVTEPLENYFYFKINSVTFSKIANALAGTKESVVAIPAMLEDSIKLPEGCFVSFAGKEVEVNDNITVKQGFFFKGLIEVFQKQAELEIVIDPTFDDANFKAKVDIRQAIVVGDFLTIYKSKEEKTKGPLMKFGLKTSPTLFVSGKIEGAFTLWGIEASTKIHFENDYMKFQFSGSLFDFFPANIEAEFKKEQKGTTFHVTAKFDLKGKVKDLIKSLAESLLKKIKDKLFGASRFVQVNRLRMKRNKGFFDFLKKTYHKGKEFYQLLKNPGEILDITGIEFDLFYDSTQLKKKQDPSQLVVKLSINATVLGKPKNFTVDFDFNKKAESLQKIVEKLWDIINPK